LWGSTRPRDGKHDSGGDSAPRVGVRTVVVPPRARRLHRLLPPSDHYGLGPYSPYCGEYEFSEDQMRRPPAARVDPPKIRQEEITPLDAEQARRFLHVARGDRFKAFYVLSLTTGLRMGEALGLRWSDVDLDAGTLRVNRQVQRMRGAAASCSASRRTPAEGPWCFLRGP
jgi:integrase